jgi:hypothetical protein
MNRIALCIAALLISLTAGQALADAPLHSRLGLNTEQARQVNDIQAAARRSFAAKRQDFNRESRALRRARLNHDSAEMARLERVTEALREELRQMRQDEDDRIRALLDARQKQAFEAYIVERRQMHGSSRDERLFD